MIDWKPIASAPLDGTLVLLLRTGFHNEIAAGYYRSWSYLDWEQVDKVTQTKTKLCQGAEWCYARSKCDTLLKPTHWALYIDLFSLPTDMVVAA